MRRRALICIISFLAASALLTIQVEAISWKKDLNAALKEAKQSRTPVMVDFYTKWCRWCKDLERNTYSDNSVNELSAHFICVRVDAEEDPATANRYSIRGYPTILFLDYNGSVNTRVIGYRAPDSFSKTMESVLEKMGVSKKDIDMTKDYGLHLNGIIYNKQKTPVAIINNTFVKEGDSIGKGRVSRITKDKVEVLLPDKTVTLTMD